MFQCHHYWDHRANSVGISLIHPHILPLFSPKHIERMLYLTVKFFNMFLLIPHLAPPLIMCHSLNILTVGRGESFVYPREKWIIVLVGALYSLVDYFLIGRYTGMQWWYLTQRMAIFHFRAVHQPMGEGTILLFLLFVVVCYF